MPHVTIEYSANVGELANIDALVAAVHTAALADGLPALDALRTRAVARHHYRIADGDASLGFVAITARVGPGRSAGTLRRFLRTLIDAADTHIARLLPEHPVALSAEIRLIDPDLRINRNYVRTHRATTMNKSPVLAARTAD